MIAPLEYLFKMHPSAGLSLTTVPGPLKIVITIQSQTSADPIHPFDSNAKVESTY